MNLFKKKELKDELKAVVSEIQETIKSIEDRENAAGVYKEVLDVVEFWKREARDSVRRVILENIFDAIKEERDRNGLDTTGLRARLAYLRERQYDIIAKLLIAE